MNGRIILTDFLASVKTWSRSKGTLFWTIAFPIILILIFGAIFSGANDVEYTIHVQDLDDSEMSAVFLEVLNETGVFKLEFVKDDISNITKYIKEENIKRLLVIPKDYQETLQMSFTNNSVSVNLSYYFDPTEQQSNAVIRGVISNIIQSMNLNLSGGSNIIGIKDISTLTDEFNFIDFFLPGMIGFTIMQTCIYGSIERNTKFRKDGILRKLLTTPITRTDWILSKMLFMLFLSFITTTLIILVGMLVYSVTIHITPLMIITVIATSFLFSGMGMLIGRFVKEEETADTAGGAISFPMMFLAGTFFPLEQMPSFLQAVARVLPLYYVNEALRNTMIYMKESDALINAVIVILFAAVFFIAGVVTTKWHED